LGCCVFVGESGEGSGELWVRWRCGRKSGGKQGEVGGKIGL
nr:hypothetical protein [Tanacetum cinerariifolium]